MHIFEETKDDRIVGNLRIKRAIFRKIRDGLLDSTSKIFQTASHIFSMRDFNYVTNIAQKAPAINYRKKDLSSKEWNVLRNVCYRYSKKRCEEFFKDSCFNRLFMAVYDHLLN